MKDKEQVVKDRADAVYLLYTDYEVYRALIDMLMTMCSKAGDNKSNLLILGAMLAQLGMDFCSIVDSSNAENN